jgi:predicted RNA binding protein YcfA (HicA-like mRNA interferase family)
MQELITGFRGSERLLTKEQLFAWITNRISNHIEAWIEGERVRSPRDIAKFLYRLGFIVARSEGEGEQYEHYRFDQMPDFLSTRTGEDFGVKWEIHPCYRQALDIRKLDQSHRERFRKLRDG